METFYKYQEKSRFCDLQSSSDDSDSAKDKKELDNVDQKVTKWILDGNESRMLPQSGL